MTFNGKSDFNNLRVAVVHDWLTVYAGAEKVLEQILEVWPNADVFSVIDFLSDSDRRCIRGKKSHTTFIQKLPFAKRKYRAYLPLMPIAIEQLDVSGYDLIISSSHAVAKGVITGPDQFHVSYVHSPIRYAWDLQNQYLHEAGLTRGAKSAIVRAILHYMRIWDHRTSNGVDLFIANSAFIARRIQKVYRRKAEVVYPPCDIERFTVSSVKEDFYLTASRMVPYKKIPLIVEAFASMPDKKLVVVGDGPEFHKAQRVTASNVALLGYQSNEALVELMRQAKAFVFAAEEDFGITPVEAQACGTPVIAYGRGGALETVIGDVASHLDTGHFFYEQSVDAIRAAVKEFEVKSKYFSPEVCRANAERFSMQIFREKLFDVVQDGWNRRFH